MNNQDYTLKYTYSSAGVAVAVRTKAKQGTTTTNTLHYLYSDHLGSTSTVTNSSGGQVQQTRFLPFGGYWGTPTQTVTDRGYTGHLHNDEVGLIYMNARFYVPSIGRFASADTIVPNPTNPQAFNRYSYVKNNPLNRVDPTGHVDCAMLGDESDSAGCETAKEKVIRPKIELSLTQKKLIATAAFIEMNGHGDAQAIAIYWVTLNRLSGLHGNFTPNPTIKSDKVAARVIRFKQFAYAHEIAEEPNLTSKNYFSLVNLNKGLKDKNGNPLPEFWEWVPNPNMALEDIINEVYDYYIGDDTHYLEMLDNVINDYNSGKIDPTNNSIYYQHAYRADTLTTANNLNVKGQEPVVFPSTRTHGVIRDLITHKN